MNSSSGGASVAGSGMRYFFQLYALATSATSTLVARRALAWSTVGGDDLDGCIDERV